jgi:hypothetical protein
MYPLTQIYLIIRTIIGGVPSRKIDHVSSLRSALPTASGGDIVKSNGGKVFAWGKKVDHQGTLCR